MLYNEESPSQFLSHPRQVHINFEWEDDGSSAISLETWPYSLILEIPNPDASTFQLMHGKLVWFQYHLGTDKVIGEGTARLVGSMEQYPRSYRLPLLVFEQEILDLGIAGDSALSKEMRTTMSIFADWCADHDFLHREETLRHALAHSLELL